MYVYIMVLYYGGEIVAQAVFDAQFKLTNTKTGKSAIGFLSELMCSYNAVACLMGSCNRLSTCGLTYSQSIETTLLKHTILHFLTTFRISIMFVQCAVCTS